MTPCCPRIVDTDSKILVTQSTLEDLMPNTKYNLTVYAHNDVERSPGTSINVKTALPAWVKRIKNDKIKIIKISDIK